jgi:protein-L-isoaspartate(D-aspartate) O-methyltransferase
VLPVQFDEYVWFDETQAVRALPASAREGVPDTYPFGV